MNRGKDLLCSVLGWPMLPQTSSSHHLCSILLLDRAVLVCAVNKTISATELTSLVLKLGCYLEVVLLQALMTRMIRMTTKPKSETKKHFGK